VNFPVFIVKHEISQKKRLYQHYQRIRAKLETLSAEQLNLYIHEVKLLLEQLRSVVPDRESPNLEMSKQSSLASLVGMPLATETYSPVPLDILRFSFDPTEESGQLSPRQKICSRHFEGRDP
jgi:N-glycosylase/DNA lyase